MGKCGPSSKQEANFSNAGDFAFCVERSARGEIDKAEFEERRQVPAEAWYIRLRMLTLGQGASATSGNPA